MYSIGAVIYLLDQFCNSENPSVREQTAGLFAKMITDKLVGPRVRIIMGKFLPYIFMDAMRDSPEAAVNMFESMFIYLLPPYPHPPLSLPIHILHSPLPIHILHSPLPILILHFPSSPDNQENPELIWNDDSREKVSDVVHTMTFK